MAMLVYNWSDEPCQQIVNLLYVVEEVLDITYRGAI